MKVYWGITASRSYSQVIPRTEPMIISAAGLWNGHGFRRKRLDWPDWALDSGGFTALNRWGDFPFSPDQYLALVDERKPAWAASMDYPCEPDISRGTLLTVADRIAATVDLGVYLCNRSDRIVPVLQGYTAEEFEECWRLLSAKMPVSRLAVGSVCRRQSTEEIAGLCWALRDFLPPMPVHGFGVKLRALRYPQTWALFSSIDTNAWEYRARRQHLPDLEAWQGYQALVVGALAAPRQLMLSARQSEPLC